MDTRNERIEKVNRAVALSTLDADEPSEFTMGLAEQFIENEIDQVEMTNSLVCHYGGQNGR